MSTGPLRRVIGSLGLVALIPIAALVALGSLKPEEAAIRALIVVGVVLVLGRVARFVLATMLTRFERRTDDRTPEGSGGTDLSEGRAPGADAPSPAGG